MGKVLTEVRSSQGKLMPDIVGLESREQTDLRGIANKAKVAKQHRFQNLYRCLNAAFLLECWHDLRKDAASGVDGVTKESYAKDLHANLHALVERLKRKQYRTKHVRRCHIPKGNGKERPLGIPALEDKLVQLACARLLGAIYEQDFLSCSYGYRPGRGAKEAVRELTHGLQFGNYGYVVEADIKSFFDRLDHDWLLTMLEERIDDRVFLNLIRKWLKAGILESDGHLIHPKSGTPQGGNISPILANVYLHYVLDLWVEKVVKPHCRGDVRIVRYADDWICAFRFKGDADLFFRVLPKRLKKFNLELAREKTNILRFSRFHPGMRRWFCFLGFEFFWKEDRAGVPRVTRRTDRTKFQGACRRIKEWIRFNRHLPKRIFVAGLNRRLRGHYNYYGVYGNFASIKRFYDWAKACAFKWLNRRGGKRKSYNWPSFDEFCQHVGLELPCITEVKRRCRVV